MKACYNLKIAVFNFLKKIAPYNIYYPVLKKIRYAFSFIYSGDKYECPFCGGRFNKFLAAGFDVPVLKKYQVVGGGYRKNTLCPRCFSVDRERNLYLYLNKYHKEIFSQNIKILHIAPEKNLALKLKSFANIDYISADLNPQLADIQMDITDIKYADNSFDVVICNHVLEHIIDDAKAMSELYRVLKIGGFAILQAPISFLLEETIEDFSITNPKERERVFGQTEHVRLYGKDYVYRLERVGLKVNIIDFIKDMNQSDIIKYCLLEEEKIFLCLK